MTLVPLPVPSFWFWIFYYCLLVELVSLSQLASGLNPEELERIKQSGTGIVEMVLVVMVVVFMKEY